MAVTALTTSWLGYDPDTTKVMFWDGVRFRPLVEAAGFAPVVHGHGISDISGLIAALQGLNTAVDGKLDVAGGEMTGTLALPMLSIGDGPNASNLTGDNTGLYIGGNRIQTVDNRPVGILRQMQSFIASGNWQRSSGIKRILSFVWGGGGGGGGAQGGAGGGACGAGGGAGGFCWKMIDVTSIESIAIAIGPGGVAGTTAGGTGGTGGTTSFGPHCSATGGVGGTGQTSGNFGQIVQGGSGGAASGGDFNVIGSAGAPGIRLDINNGIAGRGAASALLSGGGNGFAGNATGQNGFARGDGGGGGVVASNATGRAGGVGATGMAWVWEFE